MADYGAKASPTGYDINDVQDYLLTFSSSWFSPSVRFSTESGVGQYFHNIGYPLLVITTQVISGEAMIFTDISGTFTGNTSVIVNIPPSGATDLVWYVFNLDITRTFTAPTEDGNNLENPDINYGMKVSLDGKDISSTDLRDFALDTSAVSPQVHMVRSGTATAGGPLGWTATVNHNLGYTPFVLCFYRKSGEGSFRPINDVNAGIAPARYEVDSTKVVFHGDNFDLPSAPEYSIVIFKNPYTQNNTTVSYP